MVPPKDSKEKCITANEKEELVIAITRLEEKVSFIQEKTDETKTSLKEIKNLIESNHSNIISSFNIHKENIHKDHDEISKKHDDLKIQVEKLKWIVGGISAGISLLITTAVSILKTKLGI